jgi:hypothetical protein
LDTRLTASFTQADGQPVATASANVDAPIAEEPEMEQAEMEQAEAEATVEAVCTFGVSS